MLKSPLYFKNPKTNLINNKLIIEEKSILREINIGNINRIEYQSILWFLVFYRKNVTLSFGDEKIVLYNMEEMVADELIKNIRQINNSIGVKKLPLLIFGTSTSGFPIDYEIPRWVTFLLIGVAILIFITILIFSH